MIDLKETEKEYLLYIPPTQKERARQIQGRRWDIERKAWVYPRTQRMYSALLAEFADDLIAIDITPPETGTYSSVKKDNLEKQNTVLQEKLENISKTVEALVSEKSGEEKMSVLQAKLADQSSMISSLQFELKNTQQTLRSSQAESDQLLQETRELQQQVKSSNSETLEESLIKLAISSTGNDGTFELTLKRIGMDNTFPIEFCKVLEHCLRNMLKTNDRELSLYELLSQARDAELMPDEAFDLAHSIRKQRNVLAHHDVDARTRKIRILYVITAASLLWPHLDA